MNIKTMATIVGTLSLGTLATGCATAKPAASTMEKGSEASCKGNAAASQEKGGEAQCSGQKAATTGEKGGEHGCGAAGCGASKPQ